MDSTLIPQSQNTVQGPPATLESALKALEAIESIVSDDFCGDLEMRTLIKKGKGKLTGDLKVCEEKIGRVYTIAHAEVPTHCCYHVHDDWRTIKDEVLKEAQERTDTPQDSGIKEERKV